MIIPNKIKKLIEDNFTDIDQWATKIAVFISWRCGEEEYCVSYSDKSRMFIISNETNTYFKFLNNENQVIREIKERFNLDEKCNC